MKQLVFLSAQTHPDIRRESFYFELYGTVPPTTGGSKRKVYIESNDPVGDDGESVELGVRSALATTVTLSEEMASESPPSGTMLPEQVSELHNPSVIHDLHMPSAIQRTGLDKKKMREDTVKQFKLKANTILKSHKIKNTEIAVSFC